RALEPVPAVVLAAGRPTRLPVDLLPRALADVGDPEVARRRVEREPPRVAQAVRPDLGPGARAGDEGGVPREAVRPAAVARRREARDLAEQALQRLPVLLRVAAAAAVAHPDVEVAVAAERELAAVVVRVRLLDEQQLAARAAVDAVPGHRVLHDPGVAVG